MQDCSGHYQSVANEYDDLSFYNEDYLTWLTEKISVFLALDVKDVLIDLGGGTGSTAGRLYQYNHLQHNVLCVEPSQPMLDKAKAVSGVTPYRSDALSFSKEQNRHYNKMLMAAMIHHLNQRKEIFNGFFEQMPEGGKILILTRPQRTSLPFFKDALEAFAQSQTEHSVIKSELKTAGFSVEAFQEPKVVKMRKLDWYKRLRLKFMSNLHGFSDETIEAGIDELENRFKTTEVIDVTDTLTFMLAEK